MCVIQLYDCIRNAHDTNLTSVHAHKDTLHTQQYMAIVTAWLTQRTKRCHLHNWIACIAEWHIYVMICNLFVNSPIKALGLEWIGLLFISHKLSSSIQKTAKAFIMMMEQRGLPMKIYETRHIDIMFDKTWQNKFSFQTKKYAIDNWWYLRLFTTELKVRLLLIYCELWEKTIYSVNPYTIHITHTHVIILNNQNI